MRTRNLLSRILSRAARAARVEGRVGVVAAVLVLALAACGFQPLYGTGGRDTVAEFADTAIAEIPDRAGQIVRNRLIDRMTPDGQPREPSYILAVNLQQREEGVAFQRDEEATRVNIALEAAYVLSAARDGTVLDRGETRAVAAYNLVRSEFANIAAKQDAIRRVAIQVADDLSLRLGLYFRSDERRP